MDETQLENLVKSQVKNVLKRTSFVGPYNVLGILTHMGQGIEELFCSLMRIAKEKTSILIWTTNEIDNFMGISARSSAIKAVDVIINSTGDFSLKYFKQLDYIIQGGFSFEVAKNLTLLQDSNSVVNILLQGLLSKIPVYIVTPFSSNEQSFEYGPSGILMKELNKRLSFLLEMGFRLVDVTDINDQFIKHTPTTPDLITEDYLEKLKEKTSEIFVPHSTIITPLALEKAKSLKIKIIKI
ncbi:MAG: hypothetical protein ACW97W_14080 [Candidatus Hodarchaeales archaeon]|jgi:hypothetical protein